MSELSGADEMIAALQGLEGDELLDDVAHEMAEVIPGLIRDGFQGAHDPYGTPWAPRRGRYSWPVLDRSGDMKGSFDVGSNAVGVKVVNPVVYSPFHQGGTRFIDARAMLPQGQDLGTWEQPLREAADVAFARFAKRVA